MSSFFSFLYLPFYSFLIQKQKPVPQFQQRPRPGHQWRAWEEYWGVCEQKGKESIEGSESLAVVKFWDEKRKEKDEIIPDCEKAVSLRILRLGLLSDRWAAWFCHYILYVWLLVVSMIEQNCYTRKFNWSWKSIPIGFTSVYVCSYHLCFCAICSFWLTVYLGMICRGGSQLCTH